jgi:hypothetical protein
MQTPQNEIPARLYAGLYLGTRQQKRFWGWSSRGWGNVSTTEAARPLKTLAAWLRLAHAQLDGNRAGSPATEDTATFPAIHFDIERAGQQSGKNRRFQFVCNRRMIGLLIR